MLDGQTVVHPQRFESACLATIVSLCATVSAFLSVDNIHGVIPAAEALYLHPPQPTSTLFALGSL